MSSLKTAFLETRPQFLLLSLTLVMVGASASFYAGYHHTPHTLMALVGLLAFHISVNVLNDYYDYKTGIDLNTRRTPFSGGSGFLPQGRITPRKVYAMGLISLGIGCLIGIYFTFIAGWEFLLILFPGIIAVCFYNPLFSKIFLGEVFAGLGLGLLPVLGIHLIITGMITPFAFFAAMPPFFLTFNLLFLNEFPDSEADRLGGRKHLVMLLGKKGAGIFYIIITFATYVWILSGILMDILPPWTMLALLTIPAAVRAVKGALADYDDFEGFIPAQAANVIVVLGTQAFFALGFLIAAL